MPVTTIITAHDALIKKNTRNVFDDSSLSYSGLVSHVLIAAITKTGTRNKQTLDKKIKTDNTKSITLPYPF
jgi:hypothetical protein